jgi:hypothetical protein
MLRDSLSFTSMAIIIAGSVATGAVSLSNRTAFAAQPDPLLLSPPTSSGGSIKVTVGLRILNLSSIQEVSEHFELAGNPLAEWRDPRLRYNPAVRATTSASCSRGAYGNRNW